MVEALPTEKITIDGSLYEGGGQIIRNSLALSALLQKPVKIEKIRDNRPNPGINRQLKTAIDIMQKVTGALVSGDTLKSRTITFEPKGIRSGKFVGDCQTAGSITLMMQMLFPTLLFTVYGCKLTLMGGTNVNKSPPINYTRKQLSLLLKQMGIELDLTLVKDGFFPSGGGEILLNFPPRKEDEYLKPIELLERGKIQSVYMQFILKWDNEQKASDLFKELRKDFKRLLRASYKDEEVEEIEFEYEYTFSSDLMKAKISENKGTMKKNKAKGYAPKEEYHDIYGIVCLVNGKNFYWDCSCVCHDEVKLDEGYYKKVLDNFDNALKEPTACVDEFSQDQLLIYMALAKGISRIRIQKELSDHSKACFYVFEKFLPELKTKIFEEESSSIIEIEGIGYSNAK